MVMLYNWLVLVLLKLTTVLSALAATRRLAKKSKLLLQTYRHSFLVKH